LILISSLRAQERQISNAGAFAAPFTMISIDARGLAMGGAATSVQSGIAGAIWNPSALAEAQHSFFISQAQWIADIRINQAGVNFTLGNMGNIGAYMTVLDYGEMKVRTVQKPEGTGENFDAADFSLALYYARNLTDRLKFGIALKYISQRIWHSSAATAAFDIGTHFHTPLFGVDFAASISNFGGDMRLFGRDNRVRHDIDPVMTGNNDKIPAYLELESWPLPILLRIGLSRRFHISAQHSFIFAADADYPQDNYPSLNLGAEYAFRKMFFLRIGYRGAFLVDNLGGLSGGLGYDWRLANMNWSVNVAAVYWGILKNITVLSFTLSW